MEQTVYADLLFLINFSMDFLCLFLVARLLAKPFSVLRSVVAAILGGLYSVVILFIDPVGLGWIPDLLFCVLICAVSFYARKEGFRALLLTTAVFFLISMLLGGIMTAIFNLMNRAAPPLDAFTDSHDIPLWLFALVTALASLITRLGGRFLHRRAQVTEARVEITLGKRRAVLQAMCDSGNLLRDTVSGKPVIVSDTRNAANLLPADLGTITQWTAETIAELPPNIAARIRLIPMGTVGSDGIIPALRPDSVIVRVGNRVRRADALIGFADIHCSLQNCTAIIPPELLT